MPARVTHTYTPKSRVAVISQNDASLVLARMGDGQDAVQLPVPVAYPYTLPVAIGDRNAEGTTKGSDVGFPNAIGAGAILQDTNGDNVVAEQDLYLNEWVINYYRGMSGGETIDTGVVDGQALYLPDLPTYGDVDDNIVAQLIKDGLQPGDVVGWEDTRGKTKGYIETMPVSNRFCSIEYALPVSTLFQEASICCYGKEFQTGQSYYDGNIYLEDWFYWAGALPVYQNPTSICFAGQNCFEMFYNAFVREEVRIGTKQKNWLTSLYLPDDGYGHTEALQAVQGASRKADATIDACDDSGFYCSTLQPKTIIWNQVSQMIADGFFFQDANSTSYPYYWHYSNNPAVFPYKRKRGFKGRKKQEGGGVTPGLPGLPGIGTPRMPLIPLLKGIAKVFGFTGVLEFDDQEVLYTRRDRRV